MLNMMSGVLTDYVEIHRRRFARADAEVAVHSQAALSIATRIAEKLVETFCAQCVVLIGSLARGDFRDHSDIDLVVAGISASRFFDACAAADREAGDIAVDLIPLEDANPLVLRRIDSEGKELAHAP